MFYNRSNLDVFTDKEVLHYLRRNENHAVAGIVMWEGDWKSGMTLAKRRKNLLRKRIKKKVLILILMILTFNVLTQTTWPKAFFESILS